MNIAGPRTIVFPTQVSIKAFYFLDGRKGTCPQHKDVTRIILKLSELEGYHNLSKRGGRGT